MKFDIALADKETNKIYDTTNEIIIMKKKAIHNPATDE